MSAVVCFSTRNPTHSCIRLLVGRRLTHFITIKHLRVEILAHDSFAERWTEGTYPVGQAATHYLHAMSLRKAPNPKVKAHLETLVANATKEFDELDFESLTQPTGDVNMATKKSAAKKVAAPAANKAATTKGFAGKTKAAAAPTAPLMTAAEIAATGAATPAPAAKGAKAAKTAGKAAKTGKGASTPAGKTAAKAGAAKKTPAVKAVKAPVKLSAEAQKMIKEGKKPVHLKDPRNLAACNAATLAKTKIADAKVYKIADASAVKGGLVKEFVDAAKVMKKFSRGELIAKFSKKHGVEKMRNQFYFCTGAGIFVPA